MAYFTAILQQLLSHESSNCFEMSNVAGGFDDGSEIAERSFDADFLAVGELIRSLCLGLFLGWIWERRRRPGRAR